MRRPHPAVEGKKKPRVYVPGDWDLCRERCLNCGPLACTLGVKEPPEFADFPQPPQACPKFKGRPGWDDFTPPPPPKPPYRYVIPTRGGGR